MYILSLSTQGETTSQTVYANVIDAATDYAATVARFVPIHAGEDVAATLAVDIDAAIASVVRGPGVSTLWHDTSDTDGGHTVEIDDTTPYFVARLGSILLSPDEIDSAHFVASRAEILPTLTADDLAFIADAVERSQHATAVTA